MHTPDTLKAAINSAFPRINDFAGMLESTGRVHFIERDEILRHSRIEARPSTGIATTDREAKLGKTADPTIYWHGSASGDLRGGRTGLHLGTRKAAKQALEANIGVPATGEWDGVREYGKTLLAGENTLDRIHKETNSYPKTGLNAGEAGNPIPKEDYYPRKVLKYADGTDIPMDIKPNILPYKLDTEMTNARYTPHPDWHANGYMGRQLKLGNAKRGYYYQNISEDAGSISVVVPNGRHVAEVKCSADGLRILSLIKDGQTYLMSGNIGTGDNVKDLVLQTIRRAPDLFKFSHDVAEHDEVIFKTTGCANMQNKLYSQPVQPI